MAQNDPRFTSMHSAPIFKKTQKQKYKITIDDRFKNVLTDDRFRLTSNESVDKYGRKKKSKVTAADELKEFYQIDDGQDEKKAKRDEKEGKTKKTSLNDVETRLDYLNKLSRGEISGSSSDDEEEDDDDDNVVVDDSSGDDDDDDDDLEDGKNGEKIDPFAIPGDVIEESADVESNRLAIQNCDWENLTAEDIMVILQSLCPLSGSVKSVTVYPSDYGLSCMTDESLNGPPKFIWKSNPTPQSNSRDNESEEDSDDSHEDSDSNKNDDPDDEDEDDEDEDDDINLIDINDLPQAETSGSSAKGDFTRPAGSRPGIVFQHDNGDDSDHDTNGNDNTKSRPKKGNSGAATSDIDAVALRSYELSKLRYYFAIAIVNSPATADHLYREVDGLELEHSSMALDLRIVPPDVNFEGRQIRDHCDKVSVDYVPPTEFVMNAMQHTDVKCTWETGDDLGGSIENARDRIMSRRRAKETTASKWRDLQESDMLQYMASSGSESDNSDASDSDDNTHGKKKSKKAAMMRKMLLGDDADDDIEEDDFFLHDDPADDANEDIGDNDDNEDDDVHKVMSFVPKDDESVDEETETPAEAAKRKRLQKKLNKKGKVKEFDDDDNDDLKHDNSKGDKKKKKKKNQMRAESEGEEEEEDHNDREEEEREQKSSKQQLELLFAGEENEAVDRLKFSKKEFEKVQKNQTGSGSKKQKKRKRGVEIETDDQFKLDLQDDRFNAVLEGNNPHYGIDPLANEFRATEGMQQLLSEQQKRREEKMKLEEKTKKFKDSHLNLEGNERSEGGAGAGGGGLELESLVKKLKSKSSKDSIKKPFRH